jgi:amino acid adenylation domain-containing protein
MHKPSETSQEMTQQHQSEKAVATNQLFEKQVERTPNAVAVISDNESITYKELNKRANKIAHYLFSSGVGSGNIIGICIERSIEMIAALLAIFKTGNSYLPLDSQYPRQRLSFMIENANIEFIICSTSLKELLSFGNIKDIRLVCTDSDCAGIEHQNGDNLILTTMPEALAYVIYTSGSTGVPKGVLMSHEILVNLLQWQAKITPIRLGTRILQFSPISFDVSFQEIFLSLSFGGTLVLTSNEVRLDPLQLLKKINAYHIEQLFLPFVALQAMADSAKGHNITCPTLKHIITAGEQLQITPAIRAWFVRNPNCKLHNQYGPSESHVVTSYTLPGDPESWPALPPIGSPIDNTQVFILDSQQQLAPREDTGELYIQIDSPACGYINKIDLTNERYIVNKFSNCKSSRLYKTGDLVRFLEDGNIQFIGRADDQVKINGFRIELTEIEAVLNQYPSIKQAAVIQDKDEIIGSRLIAYIVSDLTSLSSSELRNYLSQRLPVYMLPSVFAQIAALPLTPSGKVDRKALPLLNNKQLLKSTKKYIAPSNEYELCLTAIWKDILNLDQVGIHENFFDLGGSSLLCLQVIARLKESLGIELPVVEFYQYPTVFSLSKYLSKSIAGTSYCFNNSSKTPDTYPSEGAGEIAIIGMAGRFPGADNVKKLWDNLYKGIASTEFFSTEDLDPEISESLKLNPNYVRAKGIISGADLFDASFFGINPKEAEIMDPQHRVFLEVAHEALEDAGCDPKRYNGRIGLYAGSANNTYFANNLCQRSDIFDTVGQFQIMLANDKDFLTSRVSYKLNLRGPSISINTACSTSLVAVIQAVKSLQNCDCDLALAGGVTISVPLLSGYLHQEGGILSPDGYCRPFDARAEGTLFNDGVGVVALKRLEDAIRDGDHIEALIKGVGVNNDGSNKVSFTAPSLNGQVEAIQQALNSANVSPESITYIEAHGTATPIGDPIEVAALTKAFRNHTSKTGFCAIGSIKSNIGHLVSAAGVAGLIKATLALKHKAIPPTLHYENPNPNINFSSSPFYVNTKLIDWQTESLPRRAGVSSFGVGGTNAHVVLEEWVGEPKADQSRPKHLLILSAKSENALDISTQNLVTYLKASKESTLANIAYTLQVGRQEFPYRKFVICESKNEAVQLLETGSSRNEPVTYVREQTPEVVFMFPGQSSQYPKMGLNLYKHEPVFQELVNQCSEMLIPYIGKDLRELLYSSSFSLDETAILSETQIAQPAIFTIEYALARLWMAWGVKPRLLIGHSIGELVAACIAGVFSIEDALKLVAMRGKLMQSLPRGSMLSVKLSPDDLSKRLNTQLAIAAINAPSLCVASGPDEAIQELQNELERDEVVCKLLHTSHAFHSPMMEPILESFSDVCQTLSLTEPKIPIVSSVTSKLLTPTEALDPLYWTRQIRQTVRFSEGIQTIWQQPERVLLEVGPRATLATMARQQARDLKKQVVISSLSSSGENNAELSALLQAVGQLWQTGVPVDWRQYYAHESRDRLSLPTYPFERKRYWIDPRPSAQVLVKSKGLNCIEQESNSLVPVNQSSSVSSTMRESTRKESKQVALTTAVKEVLETTSGLNLGISNSQATFLELGLDSLSLTQVALFLSKKFNLKITFRMLLEEYQTVESLVEFLQLHLPEESMSLTKELSSTKTINNCSDTNGFDQSPVIRSQQSLSSLSSQPASPNSISSIETLVSRQLEIMSRQLELLSQGAGTKAVSIDPVDIPTNTDLKPISTATDTCRSPIEKRSQSFGPGVKINKGTNDQLSEQQKTYLDQFVIRYTNRTAESKRQTQNSRSYLADPRTASGFTPLLKELVYPIITERSKGSKLWDVDGNEYIDLTNGFGSNFFGWSTPFIKEAIEKQLSKGIEIGPQTPLAAGVARMISELTGMERIAFCNTGSEAVMAAMRLARTVTGKDLIAIFKGAYHGTIDEVIVRAGANHKSLPAAPGLLPAMFENILVLDYGSPESLSVLRERADELAAVMVEPVQSRRPEIQPREFLHELRHLTTKSGAAYIFDEVVTGFRVHPGGAQAYFGLQADLATYGKVVGGGLPIGIVSGKREFMDALDGGFWQYGDDSIPEVGVTFFAGTFVRHPLVLSAAQAVLNYLKQEGESLQYSLNRKVDNFANHLKLHFSRVKAPILINHFSSFFYLTFPPEVSHGSLLFYLLREKGVHIWEHRPCFFTLAHSDDDIAFLTHAFEEAVSEMQAAGFLLQKERGHETQILGESIANGKSNSKPCSEARLGKDLDGNPAWFIPDPERPGKYQQVL